MILTHIRQNYYRDTKFESLIPDAPIMIQPGNEDSAQRILRKDEFDTPEYVNAFDQLTSHPNENGDLNPSPFIDTPHGLIDVGYLLLTLGALLHPRTDFPYSDFNIPNIDPASFIADLAFAVFWTGQHEQNGVPHASAPSSAQNLNQADFLAYYNTSAPDQDLLGDIDGFGLSVQWDLIVANLYLR
jgi:hypothetical protein